MKCRLVAPLLVFFMLTVPLGCTSETGGSGDQWDVENGSDAGTDSATPDGDSPDGMNTEDGGGQDVPDPDDAGGSETEDPVFETSSLVGTTWYGIFRLAENEGISGSAFEVALLADNQVEIGAFGEVTGSWEIFDSRRLRVYNLERNGQPNQPEQFVFDVDTDDQQRALGLELFIAQGPSGDPYTVRLEQLGHSEPTLAELDGDWQSEEVFPDDNGNDTRIAIRFFGERMGYGFYNGAYIEYVTGNAHVLSLNTGKNYWLLLPPGDGPERPAFGGEIQTNAAGERVIYAPRQTNPGEQPAEFTSDALVSVPGFSL